MFWNVHSRRVFLQNTSKTVVEHFTGLFERTFDLAVEPQVPGIQAARFAREKGVLETLREARPVELTAKSRPLAITVA